MKLATFNNGSRDGELLVVNKAGTRALRPVGVAATLQAALDRGGAFAELQSLYEQLEAGGHPDAFDLRAEDLCSPLPRAYAWLDGSAYINHVILVRKARGAEPPPTLETDPLMYQGGSDIFLRPRQDIPLADPAWGLDFESEVAVIVDDTPMGVSVEEAAGHIRLLMLCNDVSLRNLIPAELAKSFGFLQSKPSSAFSPMAITLDELGDSWRDTRVHLPLDSHLNGAWYGSPEAGPEMHFNFAQLIAHVAKTRPLAAGSIIGSGTVSNKDRSKGSSCLAEKRMIEKIDTGEFRTPFMAAGDRIQIEMKKDGASLFGMIDQKVVAV